MNVPSAAELQKARDDTANFIPALVAGGDAGKAMWLASCGLEYPDVGVRVMEPPMVDGDTLTLKVFRGATPEEIEAATTSNMQVKVVGQPEAKKLEKDAVVRFTGTLTGYTQNPFMLTWDKAKINTEDLRRRRSSQEGPAKKAPLPKRLRRRLSFTHRNKWPRKFRGHFTALTTQLVVSTRARSFNSSLAFRHANHR